MKSDRIAFLDCLRGLAIVVVFGFHCVDLYSPVSQVNWVGLWRQWPDAPAWLLPWYTGWIGVPLFFVISGLCIQLSHLRSVETGRNAHWGLFYLQRFFRVYPPYLIVFLTLWLMAEWRHHPVNGTSLVSHLGLMQNLWPGWMYDLNAALWSVAVEWQLYLIFPVIWWASRRWGWSVCLTWAAGLEMFLNIWPMFNQLGVGRHMPGFLGHSPFAYGFSWSLGAALADSYKQQKPILLQWWHMPLWGGLLLSGLCFKPLYPLTFLYAALLFASLLSRLLFRPVRLPAWWYLPYRHLSWVGAISYSIYLWHLPVINIYPWLTRHISGLMVLGHWTPFVSSLLLWPIILLIAWAYFYWVEKPCIQLGKHVQNGILAASRQRISLFKS